MSIAPSINTQRLIISSNKLVTVETQGPIGSIGNQPTDNIVPFTFIRRGSGDLSVSNVPSAFNFLNNTTNYTVRLIPLNGYTKVRADMMLTTATSNITARLRIRYNTSYSISYADYTSIAKTGELELNFYGVSSPTFVESAWLDLPDVIAGTQTDIWLALGFGGGDGVLDVTASYINVYFK